MDLKTVATGAFIAAIGVILAGLFMKHGRDSVPLLMQASDGFDT